MVPDKHEHGLGHRHIGVGGIPWRNLGAGSRRYLGEGRICWPVNFGTIKITKEEAVGSAWDEFS